MIEINGSDEKQNLTHCSVLNLALVNLALGHLSLTWPATLKTMINRSESGVCLLANIAFKKWDILHR
ncbi:MAG: hypothetical protein V4605_07385 [Pseudomonadota bacterium]